MNNADFETLIHAFINRPADMDDQLPAELVFATLDREEAEHPLCIESAVKGNRLTLSVPPGMKMPPQVREIAINLPGVQVVVSLGAVVA